MAEETRDEGMTRGLQEIADECNSEGEFDRAFRGRDKPLRVGDVSVEKTPEGEQICTLIEQDKWGATSSIRYESEAGGRPKFEQDQSELALGISNYFGRNGLNYKGSGEEVSSGNEAVSVPFYFRRSSAD
jgi:hypothetical protein